MQSNKSLKLDILALLFVALTIFSGCAGTAPPINHAPTIISAEITTTFVEAAYIYDVDAIDPDTGDILIYSLSVNPVGMDIDPATGVINWTPTDIGSFEVTVEVSDGELTATQDFMITVSPSSARIVYRALCVGVGDYQNFPDAYGNTDLLAPPYDVDRMRQTLANCKFGLSNTEFSAISYLKDGQATKSNILQKIASTFSGADSNDISYFYFSGHGGYSEVFATSHICPTDNNNISANELESALSAIPGTKVVILDCCSSGGFIGKGKEEIIISKENLESFNDEIINVFSQAQSKGLLTTNQYKVLTACHYYQSCGEVQLDSEDLFGLFTMVLCDGCGYDGNYYADIANDNDTRVTLNEAYEFVKERVLFYEMLWDFDDRQDVQVYPNNSNFTIVEY